MHSTDKMLSRRRQSLQHLVTHDRVFPLRLPFLHFLSRNRFKTCKKQQKNLSLAHCSAKRLDQTNVGKEIKQQKNLSLVPCSVKRLYRINVGKDIIREVEGKEDFRGADMGNVEEKASHVENEIKITELGYELPGIPIVPSNHSTKKPGIVFIFEKASLVPAYVGKNYQILNPDDHANFLRRKKKDPYNYRPEIVYLALLELMGSKLYGTGAVQAIYIRTDEGVLIKIEPHTQMPKTFGSFCAIMSELLQKFSIKAKENRGKLLRLIENPVTQHLPSNCYKIGLSFSSEKLVHLKSYLGAIKNDVNLVFVVGAMAHGKIDSDYTDELISVSQYPLSAAQCVGLICRALEGKLKIH